MCVRTRKSYMFLSSRTVRTLVFESSTVVTSHHVTAQEMSTQWILRGTKIPSENDDTTTYDTKRSIGEGITTVHIGTGAQSSKINTLSAQVCPVSCRHELSKTTYIDRANLADVLDNDKDNSIKLMKELLLPEDFIELWRSCNGGVDPATNLLFHLASNKGTTLEELWAVAASRGFQDVSDIIQNEVWRSPAIASQRLDQVAFDVLLKIAEAMSDTPDSRHKHTPWKVIASSMGLTETMIRNLDAARSQSWNNDSLTMALISFLTAKYPLIKVATVAQGLVNIGCGDALKESMFENCRGDGCILR